MKVTTIKILLYILLALPLAFFGQNMHVPWEVCYGGSDFEYCSDVIQVGNFYYVLAETMSNDGDVTENHGPKDIWLLKTDFSGNLIFEKCIGGSKGDGATNLLKITDSTFYVYGATKSVDGDISNNPYPGSASYWTMKIDKDAEIIWDIVLGGELMEYARDGIITDDGGIIQLGLTNSNDGDISNHFGFFDVWFVKLNSEGEKEWDFTLGGTSLEEAGAIIQTSDGGYAVAASTDGAGGGNYDTTCNYHGLPNGYSDVWIVKMDSNRNIEWQQCYGGFYDDGGGDIIEIEDGYIIVGLTMSNDGDVSGYHGWPGDNDYGGDIWVFKIDKQGKLLWQKCLGGYDWDFSRNIFTTTDGGFMVVGRTTSDDGDVEGYPGEGMGLYGDIWFAKLSSEGDLQWQYCYGGNGDERIYHGVIQKADYNYVIAIETDTDPWQCGGAYYFDVRVAEIDDTLTSINEQYLAQGDFYINASPNPANRLVKFDYQFRVNTSAELSIINSLGQIIYAVKLESSKGVEKVHVENWDRGVYFYSLNNGQHIESGKLIIAK